MQDTLLLDAKSYGLIPYILREHTQVHCLTNFIFTVVAEPRLFLGAPTLFLRPVPAVDDASVPSGFSFAVMPPPFLSHNP